MGGWRERERDKKDKRGGIVKDPNHGLFEERTELKEEASRSRETITGAEDQLPGEYH